MRTSRVCAIFKSLLSGLLVLSLAGCASNISRVETWEGSPANAGDAATLKAPGEIEVTSVNGRSLTNFMMDDLALDYALLPGQNQVVFTYKTIWAKSGVVENGESKVHVIESQPQVVRFDAEPGEVYRFAFDKPANRAEAEQMTDTFSATIVTGSGQEVATSSDWDPKNVSARTPLPGADSASSGVEGGTALEQLKSIWATASEEEKRAFLRWAFE
ncbi:uncharacterized protein DUF2057 [Marinobacter pelagius]|uniref:Uncharacterized protein DUF2057 n=1 Tax=Marinobacter pelagius TaxID=379482 RepID=A0A366GQL2_9GAMM|nr:DUF2057 family protein [Marinobacter pelagius]RBP29179.1 uncharacterized protein DUF2057 [Marinobacter pelagius]